MELYTNCGDYMRGIDLNKPIFYKHSSLRFFEKNEYHINRVCNDDVLLLVYEGVLRFTENGKEYEITAGNYHIQQHGSEQIGHLPSDSPKYLYVHFIGEWNDNNDTLNYCGEFDYVLFENLFKKMDRLAHGNHTLTERTAVFFDILSILYRNQIPIIKENAMAEYMRDRFNEKITLEILSEKFNYSKNQIINIFKKDFSQTPIDYLNKIRIQKALYLLEVTSNTTESIAESCGFENYSHFYRLFVRQNGVSPTEWRLNRRLTIF